MAMGYQRILLISAIMFCYTPTIVQLAGCNNKTGSDLTFLAPEIDKNHALTSLIVGEWWKVDCRLNNNDVNATVCKVDRFTAPLCENIPDGERIKSKDRNVFFITKLKLDDQGKYYCKACDIKQYAGGIEVRVEVAFARPIVTKTPNATISRYGSVVTLECSVKSLMYGMEWLKITPGGPKSLSPIGKNQIGMRKMIIYNISYLTQKDDGIYLCQIYRRVVKHTANGTIAIKTKATRPPTFLDFHATAETILLEDESLSVNYTISGTPDPFITWFRSENEREERITTCRPKSIECKTRFTKNVFTVSNVKYPKDNNVSYKCYAENIYGNSSRSFVVIVHSKPYIAPVQERRTIYTKGMQINCTIEKANPKNITFSWHTCDPGQSPCAKNKSNEMWKELLKYHSKNQTKYLISSLVIASQIKRKIIYRCTAQNSVGTDKITFEVIRIGGQFSKDSSIDLLSIALPLGSIALAILLVISFVLYKRKKIYGGLYIFSYPPLRDYIDELHPSKGIHEQVHKLPFSPEWEFPREKITLHSELGVGEFGSVWLAHAIGISEFCPRDIQKQRSNRKSFSVFLRRLGTGKNNYVCCKEVTKVAVKKLKENWDRSKLVDLQSELKILIHVGEHENIVNVLGACTKGPSSNLWIIMDYCPHGDLRTFLRHRRDSYDLKATFLAADLSQKLGPRDLVSLAFQIATGMEFLISRKIIHRDLAARNILLGLGYVPKVADFGLAREVFNYDAYVKKSSTLLPLKWMAVESLQYSVFTEKTDVWSFGILLWELFTLGQSPYPEIHNLDLYKYLLNGKRMDTPVHCPSKISQMMRDCWQGDPNDRPSFANLVKTLDEYETSFPVNQNGEDSDLDQLDELYEADDLGQNKESYLPVIFVEGGEEVQNTAF